MNRRRALVVVVVVAAVLVLGGGVIAVLFGDGDGQPDEVVATDFEFTPRQITVDAGDPLELRNDGQRRHTFTADDGRFDTGVLEPGESETVALDGPRRIRYHCDVHPRMTGVIVVEP